MRRNIFLHFETECFLKVPYMEIIQTELTLYIYVNVAKIHSSQTSVGLETSEWNGFTEIYIGTQYQINSVF